MKSTKISISGSVLLCMIFGGTSLSGDITKKKPKYVWKIATVAPNAAFLSDLVKKEFLDRLKKMSNGELAVDMYWGGTMGDEADYIAKIRIGQLHGCVLSVGGVLKACPEMAVLQLPFLFKDYDEVDYIRKKLKKRFVDIYEKNGYKMLAWFDQDFDQIYSTKYEMRNPDDFGNSKFLTHAGDVEELLIKQLGGSPIPVTVPEAVVAFRSGVCNAGISPALFWMATQLYTITKYVNAYPFRYSPATIVLSNNAWNMIPEKYKKQIEIQIVKLSDWGNKLVHKINKKCLDSMIKYGIKEVKMTPEEIEVFRARTKSIGDKLAGKLYPKKLLDEIMNHLRVYRSRKDIKDNKI